MNRKYSELEKKSVIDSVTCMGIILLFNLIDFRDPAADTASVRTPTDETVTGIRTAGAALADFANRFFFCYLRRTAGAISSAPRSDPVCQFKTSLKFAAVEVKFRFIHLLKRKNGRSLHL